jgi:uncharacterized cofD-like protein
MPSLSGILANPINRLQKSKNVLVIGGGTGTFTVLSGLKKYPVNLAVIVSMLDSGGSNRVIRDEFGLLPTSDIRQCIVALASGNSDEVLRNLFTYRYSQGIGISGMTFGNLFMAALTDIYGSQEEAIQKTCEMLEVQGTIIPVTFDNSHLVARYDNGNTVLGEHFIDEPNKTNVNAQIIELSTFPEAKANPNAIKAIRKADLIVLGPGDLFTSILSNLVVGGVADALKKTRAKIVYVVNLMTRHGQTTNFSASAHLNELRKYIGDKTVDYCIVHENGNIPKYVLERYAEEKAFEVEDDLEDDKVRVIRQNVISNMVFNKLKSDKLTRSLIRHDPDRLAKVLYSLI